jgi:hypothetical protein
LAKISSRHAGREKEFKFDNFFIGVNNQDDYFGAPSENALGGCVNMDYKLRRVEGGQKVFLSLRRGSDKITTAAAAAAPIISATYYKNQDQYIIATCAGIYYMSAGSPVLIGANSTTQINRPRFTEFNEKLIVHLGTTTKVWDGTDYIDLHQTVENEDIGDGNGSTTNFTGTLANPAVLESSVTITYISGATTYTVTDDGSGNLTGDVGAGTNTITYSTGAYDVTFSAAPDTSTDITIDYVEDGGGPGSCDGVVRQNRLYTWTRDSSRLYYTSAGDETGWHTSTGGGYVDIEPDDGDDITGAINFFDSLMIFKNSTMHRINSFPGESDFAVIPLMAGYGAASRDSIIFDGDVISFFYNDAWFGVRASERYGDIQKATRLDKFIDKNLSYNISEYSQVAYSKLDDQLWLIYANGGSTPAGSSKINVLSVGTGGQYSTFEFDSNVTCIESIDDKMLIGFASGHLHSMSSTSTTGSDGGTAYTGTVYSKFCNHNTDGIGKYNKKIRVISDMINPSKGYIFTASRNNDPLTDIETKIVSADGTSYISNVSWTKKFNYNNIRWVLSSVTTGEIYEVTFSAALVGTKNMDFTARDYDSLTFGGYSVLFGGEPAVM